MGDVFNRGLDFIMLTALCGAVLVTAGCFAGADVLSEFSVVSTRSSNAGLQLGSRVQGESCTRLLFGVIPVSGDPNANLKQAVDRALDNGKAKFLVDAIASEQTTGVPPIFHRHCYLVEGTAANSRLP